MFSHTFVLVAVTPFTYCYLPTLITPHWKVLCSWNLHHSAPLEMLFPLVSLFAKIKIFRFRPKTMDYSPWFHFYESKKVLLKVYQAKGNEKRKLIALVSVV